MQEPYDSVPRKFDRHTTPPGKNAVAAMAERGAGASTPGAPGPYPEVNSQLTDGTGLYCYKAENARYGLAGTIAALREIAAILNRRYAGRRYGVGDISLLGGGDISGHVSHEKGVDVDVRLLRGDWAEEGVVWQDSAYSRQRTQELLDLFWTNSLLAVDKIFFNDAQTQGTQPWPNHDNHFHVRFRQPGEGEAPPVLSRDNDLTAANHELQRCLNIWKNATGQAGLDLTVDGRFGQRTYDRVREFQAALGLPLDGTVRRATWDQLQQWRA
jgi:peptidoglycan hydrolase-like protein with peptidoglycan-binding domain